MKLIACGILVIATWATNFLFAQQFSIKLVEQNLTQIIIHYDLVDTTQKRTYQIFVYSSLDNFMKPITKVFGDVGPNTKPGFNKKIVWNSLEELGTSFKGDIELEVRGRIYVPFISLQGFDEINALKRKTTFPVKWTGGTDKNILNFQLYKGDKLIHQFPNAPNTHEYKIAIPGTVKPGKGYYFKISDAKNVDLIVHSSKFEIKPKMPIFLKIGGGLGLGALVYILTQGDDKKDLLDPAPGAPD